MIKFIAKVIRKIENPGAWNSIEVGVFRTSGDSEEQVGEYVRNYPNLLSTFYHFTKDGNDYALYSPDYTVTRVMSLPSCRDIGGENPNAGEFCPADYFVPSYIDWEHVDLEDKVHKHRVNEPAPSYLERRTTKYRPLDEKTGERFVVEKPSYPVTPLMYYPFGFVAGCIWGDDSSWKIQYLDLSEVEKGVVKRDERFGYIRMPDHLSLKQAISMGDYSYDSTAGEARYITIAIQKRFDLRTGKLVELEPFA